MACCTLEGTDRMFSRQARRYARKFRRKGLDNSQRLIFNGLKETGIIGKSVLEIGCGVGGLHLTLLKEGAASALGVEVSSGMRAQARTLAQGMGLADRVDYQQGDFITVSGKVPTADIVVMDKVLCCYADPGLLIAQSAAKVITTFAVSYPRKSVLSKLVFKPMEKVGSLMRWSFHPFYHEPDNLDEMIRQHGFRETYSGVTPIWQVRVYVR